MNQALGLSAHGKSKQLLGYFVFCFLHRNDCAQTGIHDAPSSNGSISRRSGKSQLGDGFMAMGEDYWHRAAMDKIERG
ncbi:hypothetical protein FOBRF1_016357 [Fusarium oxysporum]